MKTLSYIDYCGLPRWEQFFYKIYAFILKIFVGIWHFIKGVGYGIKNIALKIANAFKKMYQSFKYGDLFTRLSFLFLGVSHIKRKQYVKGITLLLLEILFIVLMIVWGGSSLYNLVTLGDYRSGVYCESTGQIYPSADVADCLYPINVMPDNSPRLLLYGIIAVTIVIVFIGLYISTVNTSYKLQCDYEEGKHIKTFKEDLSDFLNSKFHITLLALPILGVIIFSILPLIDMICMAFTNYDYLTDYPKGVFDWVGMKNFANIFNFAKDGSGFGYTFVEILKWTVVWAILATFLNFILGILVATIINRKGIKFKKFWRTCLVLSVAVPQFVSLLAISQFLNEYGPLTKLIELATGERYRFLAQAYSDIKIFNWTVAIDFPRIIIVVVNIWIGIPYTVLSTTGILMNVPEDLYESARIDGASAVTMYFKITLRYIIFVMGPSLITTFIGNFNGFGVIYLLTGGGPKTNGFYGSAGHTDLLVTWLFQLTNGNTPDYKMASVVGILIFIISSTISLIVYRNSSSFKSEEDFA